MNKTVTKLLTLTLLLGSIVAFAGCDFGSSGSSSQTSSVDITGTWEGWIEGTLVLTQSGNNVTGTLGEYPVTGTVEGNTVSLTVAFDPSNNDYDYLNGTLVDENTISGMMTESLGDYSAPFTITRQ